MRSFKIIIAITVILFVVFSALLALELIKSAKLKEEFTHQEDRSIEAQGAHIKVEKLQEELVQLQREIELVDKRIPQDRGLPTMLIKDITLVGQKAQLRNIQFEYLFDKNNQQLTTQNNSLVNRNSFDPQLIEIQMSFEGEFKSLISFLDTIYNMDRVISVESVQIERILKILPKQKVALKLVSYVF